MSWQPILVRDDNYPVPPVVISHDGEWTWKHISVGNEASVEWQHYRSGDRIAWYGSKSGLWAGISEGLRRLADEIDLAVEKGTNTDAI